MSALLKDRHYAHMIVILGTLNINRSREHSFVILSKCIWDFILFYSHKPPWKLKIAIIEGSPSENYFFVKECHTFILFAAEPKYLGLWTFM